MKILLILTSLFLICTNASANCPGACNLKVDNSSVEESVETAEDRLLQKLGELSIDECIEYLSAVKLGQQVQLDSKDVELHTITKTQVILQCGRTQ